METSKIISDKKGVVEAFFNAVEIDGQFSHISFPCVSINGTGVNMVVRLTPYGLKHDYIGEHKADVDASLKRLENKLKKAYSLTFEAEPKEVEEPIVEQQENAE